MLRIRYVLWDLISVSPFSMVSEKVNTFILGMWMHYSDFFCIWNISNSAGKTYEIHELILFFNYYIWICNTKFITQPWVIAVKLLVENIFEQADEPVIRGQGQSTVQGVSLSNVASRIEILWIKKLSPRFSPVTSLSWASPPYVICLSRAQFSSRSHKRVWAGMFPLSGKLNSKHAFLLIILIYWAPLYDLSVNNLITHFRL